MEKMDQSLVNNLVKIVQKYQKPNTQKAIVQMLTSFGPFVLIWVLMYLSLDVSLWITFGLAILNAWFLVRIFIIQHDCGHQSFTKYRKLNNIIGVVCSFLSFIPYKYWAKGHNYHHGHNGLLHEHRDIGDIDLLTSDEYRALSKWGRFKYRLFRSFPVLFLIVPTYYVLLHNRLPLINLKGWSHARRSLFFSNVGVIAFCGLLYYLLGWEALVLVQLPILMAFGTIAIWFFYVQHQHEMSYKAWKDTWDYALSAFQGSTYYKLPKVMHWLSGNIGYHHIHHLNPLVPNYELAKCHHENPIFDELATPMTFSQSLSCIFNKLWDEQEQRLISFKEFYMLEKKRALA